MQEIKSFMQKELVGTIVLIFVLCHYVLKAKNRLFAV